MMLSHIGSVTGGAEQCLLEYIEVLKQSGYKCKVVVPYKGPMTDALTTKDIAWTVVGYGWATKPHRQVNPNRIMSSTGHSLVKIFQEVEKFKPDIIITNTAVIPWGLYAGKAFGIPTVLLVHEILNEKDPSLRMLPNYREYGEILNQNADYVIYNSQFVKNEFKDTLKLPRSPKEILYPLPPLDEKKINEYFKDNRIGGKLKIAIFGALSPRKNQFEALQAMKLLRDQGINNVVLDLYGDTAANAPYTKMLKRFIRDNSLSTSVKIKGYANNVYEVMNRYNVVLSTATYEPFGRTIIEGQLFGKIVIANNTGGGRELVKDMVTGLMYESGNHDELSKKITWIIKSPVEAMALGDNAKQIQLKKYFTASKYRPLLEVVEAIEKHKSNKNSINIYNPMLSMFMYNHQLNDRYKHLYRLSHNRVTSPIKGIVKRTLVWTKKTIKQFM